MDVKWPQVTTRVCKGCAIEKPIAQFHPNGRGGWRWQCRECEKLRNYRWRANNPQAWRALQLRMSKKRSARRKLVSSIPDANEILAAGVERTCRVCGTTKPLQEFNFLPSTRHWRRICTDCRNGIKKKKYDANPEHFRRIASESFERNKGRYRADPRWMARRQVHNNLHGAVLRKKSAKHPDRLSKEDWKSICDIVDHTCVYCGSKGKLTLDHVIPVANGGTNHRRNFVPACLSCNIARSAKNFFSFCEKRGVDGLDILMRIGRAF